MMNTTNSATTGQKARTPSRIWLRIFARSTTPSSGSARSWPPPTATALLSTARGRVVEIGAGTGLNAALYPDGITKLILTEPDAAMRDKLEHRLERHGRDARILDAPADRLPFEDASVDTVVSTLVL